MGEMFKKLSDEDITARTDVARDLIRATKAEQDPDRALTYVELVFPGDTPNPVLRQVLETALGEEEPGDA